MSGGSASSKSGGGKKFDSLMGEPSDGIGSAIQAMTIQQNQSSALEVDFKKDKQLSELNYQEVARFNVDYPAYKLSGGYNNIMDCVKTRLWGSIFQKAKVEEEADPKEAILRKFTDTQLLAGIVACWGLPSAYDFAFLTPLMQKLQIAHDPTNPNVVDVKKLQNLCQQMTEFEATHRQAIAGQDGKEFMEELINITVPYPNLKKILKKKSFLNVSGFTDFMTGDFGGGSGYIATLRSSAAIIPAVVSKPNQPNISGGQKVGPQQWSRPDPYKVDASGERAAHNAHSVPLKCRSAGGVGCGGSGHHPKDCRKICYHPSCRNGGGSGGHEIRHCPVLLADLAEQQRTNAAFSTQMAYQPEVFPQANGAFHPQAYGVYPAQIGYSEQAMHPQFVQDPRSRQQQYSAHHVQRQQMGPPQGTPSPRQVWEIEQAYRSGVEQSNLAHAHAMSAKATPSTSPPFDFVEYNKQFAPSAADTRYLKGLAATQMHTNDGVDSIDGLSEIDPP
jgi:hypothetical protein